VIAYLCIGGWMRSLEMLMGLVLVSVLGLVFTRFSFVLNWRKLHSGNCIRPIGVCAMSGGKSCGGIVSRVWMP
jgi:hypothetical protein